ncbi:MAG TPA: hypothetical protein VFG09_02655 [Thermodesulfovibrionales bacterium]|nr:hypothetical protein [Thermodesulfovibrionales bacterium]
MGKEIQNVMNIEDGGATFSLVVHDRPLTLDEVTILQNLEGVERILLGDNAFTIIFKIERAWGLTGSVIVEAERAIRNALLDNTCLHLHVNR